MTEQQQPIAVLGAGSWGSTIAKMLAANGLAPRLWCVDDAEAARLTHDRHPPGVPDLRLPDHIVITSSLETALRGAAGAVFVAPAQATAALCERIQSLGLTPPLAVIASKGIDLQSLRPLSSVVAERCPSAAVAVISGPCIAREVAAGVPTSVVVACEDKDVSARVQQWFNSKTFRVYRQKDVLGVEYGGALKNVIAIAAGVCDGLGFGANSKSALLTRGLAEMTRFSVAFGAEETTISGLAGLGDLCVTCFSPHSRNRRFGEALAQGGKAADIMVAIGEVVEGAATAEAVVRIAREKNIETPIAFTVTKIVIGEWTPREAVAQLMSRELKDEF
ncbi:NAD(P)H-dependent glycerol-3-phosphate dehydrogenase [soil metagenome]